MAGGEPQLQNAVSWPSFGVVPCEYSSGRPCYPLWIRGHRLSHSLVLQLLEDIGELLGWLLGGGCHFRGVTITLQPRERTRTSKACGPGVWTEDGGPAGAGAGLREVSTGNTSSSALRFERGPGTKKMIYQEMHMGGSHPEIQVQVMDADSTCHREHSEVGNAQGCALRAEGRSTVDQSWRGPAVTRLLPTSGKEASTRVFTAMRQLLSFTDTRDSHGPSVLDVTQGTRDDDALKCYGQAAPAHTPML